MSSAAVNLAQLGSEQGTFAEKFTLSKGSARYAKSISSPIPVAEDQSFAQGLVHPKEVLQIFVEKGLWNWAKGTPIS